MIRPAILAASLMVAAAGAAQADELRDQLIGRSFVTDTTEGPAIMYFGRDGVLYGDNGSGQWAVNDEGQVCTKFESDEPKCWTVVAMDYFPAYDFAGTEVDRSEWKSNTSNEYCWGSGPCWSLKGGENRVELQAEDQSLRGVLFEGNVRPMKTQ